MAIRYVQRKDGTFAGSVGTGKSDIPSPAPRVLSASEQRQVEPDGVTQAWRAHEQHARTNGSIDLHTFRIDDSYPVPQANSLAKVAATVDAIEAGADTDEAVAVAIGVTARQGAYYANAAGYLGLVATQSSTSPRQWVLTPEGAQFLNANAQTRTNILGHVVSLIPEVDHALNDGGEVEEMLAERLGESTALRRAATVQSWLDTLTNEAKANEYLALESDGVRDRIDEARAVATRAREEARRRARLERPAAVCTHCFMVLPASGTCSNCDD